MLLGDQRLASSEVLWGVGIISSQVFVISDHLRQGCQTQGPQAYSGPPNHFMWPARAYECLTKKTKNYATLYHTLWKCVTIPHVSISIWRSIYTQKLTLVCIWYAMFFHWWRQRGRLKGIKRTSSSARAPPMEKHDILHSFKGAVCSF